ncbi:MAG: [protein-PII] uridylyltransferase, partial [Myxococcales bacterium]|nr:[protein-PII] uridylyltransferase [Myxococcales bacterium]
MRPLNAHPGIDLSRLAPGLSDTCGGYLGGYRGELEAAIRQGESGVAIVSRHARILDGLLGALYCAADASARGASSRPMPAIALVAVGGYGRGTVGLRSDVDVVFLCEDPSDSRVTALAQGLLYPLWDLGMQIGHAVRGVQETIELARDDIRTATTLLDLRRVAGDAGIVTSLEKAARRHVLEPHLGEFLDALAQDTAERHERFGGSLFLLEPEVKQGRGGLRDFDVIGWAARARWGARTGEACVRRGVLLSSEAQELRDANEMLWTIRNRLHLRARRQSDRLTFTDQEEIAEALGFVDGIVLGVEQFMQAYYRHARVVAQSAERVIERARPRRRRSPPESRAIGGGLIVFDDQISLSESEALDADPALAMRLYREVVRLGKRPYSFARDAIARKAAEPEFRARLCESVEAADIFAELLVRPMQAPLRRGSILAEMHEVGLLVAMIPELEPLTGRIQFDDYHLYTVDVHAVAAVDRLRALRRGERFEHLGLPTRLAAEAPRPLPLFIATLLHDLGKVHGARDHHRRGAEMCRPVARRLGLSQVDIEHVCWLVQEHGSLYHWAMRRDTGDPETLADLASHVGSVERLRDLYLLTVAIMSTLNPAAMNSWKSRMLEDLYLALSSHLEAGGERPSLERRAEEIRREIRVGFVGDAGQESLEAFICEMPDRYLLANPVDTIRAHARAARDRCGRPVHVILGPGPSEDLSELLVITDDRPGLLEDVAATLAANRLEIVAAQIHTRRREEGKNEAVDLFLLRRGRRIRGDGEALAERISEDLRALFEERTSAEALLRRRSRPPAWTKRRGPEIPTEVQVDNDASPR